VRHPIPLRARDQWGASAQGAVTPDGALLEGQEALFGISANVCYHKRYTSSQSGAYLK